MDFPEPFRVKGRARKTVSAEVIGLIESADLELLEAEKGSKTPPLRRLTERHHALARCLASGTQPGVAATICGYVPSRVSILQNDPAFKELIQFYRSEITSGLRTMHDKLAGLSENAIDELQDRLEEDAGAFSINQLQELVKLGADRTGHGPQSSSTNINVNVDLAARMEAARKRNAERLING